MGPRDTHTGDPSQCFDEVSLYDLDTGDDMDAMFKSPKSLAMEIGWPISALSQSSIKIGPLGKRC